MGIVTERLIHLSGKIDRDAVKLGSKGYRLTCAQTANITMVESFARNNLL